MRNAGTWLRIGALSGVVALVGSACVDDESSVLLDKSYLLESSEGFEPVTGTTVRLSFEDGGIGWTAGCNGTAGEFTVKDGRLVAKALSGTTIGCDAELHQQDEWLGNFMESRPKLELDGDRLTLVGEMATLVFLDREVASPDQPLIGTLWTINALIMGDIAEGNSTIVPPTLLLNDQGEVEIFTTCNEGSGRYEQAGNKLTLSEMKYTRQACTGESEGRFDSHIQAVMTNGEVSFELDEQSLYLRRGQQGLAASALSAPPPCGGAYCADR